MRRNIYRHFKRIWFKWSCRFKSKKKPKEFDRLREHGRRIFHHKDATSEILRETVINYEKDAIKSSKAGAYLAGIIALGAALEGTLILICLQSTPLAKAAFKEIEKEDIRKLIPKETKRKAMQKIQPHGVLRHWYRFVPKLAEYKT